MSSNRTFAFFGSTGGCVNAALVRSLKAGYTCSALVRNADKLTNLLKDKGISEEQISRHLRICTGDAKDPESIAPALVDPQTNQCVDTIIYGVGGTFTMANPLRPSLTDPTICEKSTNAILSALEQIKPTRPPLVLAISTTGMPPGARDIPLAYIPLYHWMLAVPHADKQKMEASITGAPKSVIRDWILVRPTLLFDQALSYGKLQVGYEGRPAAGGEGTLTMEEGGTGWKGLQGMAIGYSIGREDVGAWIYEEVITKTGDEWLGKRVTLTC